LTLLDLVLLFLAAMLAGALNSVAGGGSFISFPTLVFTGVPPINANATNTVALWPGSVASVGAYRTELSQQNRRMVITLVLVSIIGGLSGAELLLRTPQEVFVALIPWLLLAATLLFTFGGNLTARLRTWINTRMKREAGHTPAALFALVVVAQFLISVYGGYFGGGIGILMLAALSLAGMTNIHNMNALKTLLASFINGMAVLRFIISGTIFWPQAILMIVGAIIGGYGGASYARRINPTYVRRFVIGVGFAMTFYFFFLR
jgi:uncharacterized membrane protein YfcA